MCGEEAVTFQEYSGKYLCRRHFIEDIEAKAKHTIRSRGWLKAGDHIGVVVSGNCSGMALVFFLHSLFSKRKDVRITAVILDKDPDISEKTDYVIRIAGELGIPIVRGSIPEMPGQVIGRAEALGDAVRAAIPDGPGKEHGITKFAVPYCLDDGAVSLLTDMLRGEAGHIFSESPGGTRNDRLPVIAPFIAIAEDDIMMYAKLLGLESCNSHRPRDDDKFGEEVRTLLDIYTGRHPSTKYSLMHLGESIRNAGTTSGVSAEAPARCGGHVHDTCLGGRDFEGGGRP
jgi:tRNA(Ile)-lysidine synthase TilS/MesJ